MENDPYEDIFQIITNFNKSIESLLPALEAEVNDLIKSGYKERNSIEQTLDTLLSLVNMGFAENLFLRLLDYYKTIDEEGAAFYWNEYDNHE
jgi:hypothetical protein